MNKHLTLVIILPALMMLACNKKDNTGTPNITGQATLIVTPLSNGIPTNLAKTTVSIKYNTLTAPAGISYDSDLVCNNAGSISYVTFHTMPNGNYHLYAISYDTSLKVDVQGDLAYTITAQTSQPVNLNMLPPGRGGLSPLVIIPQRYGLQRNLLSGIVYIKYNSLVAPANGQYDDTIYCHLVNAAQVAYINDMARGNYYIKATAYDTSISQAVSGTTTLQVNSTDSATILLPVL